MKKDRFWLIQRGTFNSDLNAATKFLGGSYQHLIDPDYMGAAEFEWGAIPKAYRRILGQFSKYSLHVTDLVTTGGVPFCIYCRDDRYEEVLEAIKRYLNEDHALKEWTNMHAHFNEPKTQWDKDHRKWQIKTNFWWCIDVADPYDDEDDEYANHVGDWIAFTGATDRQKKFVEILQRDYDEWWSKMTSDEQTEELSKAFCRF